MKRVSLIVQLVGIGLLALAAQARAANPVAVIETSLGNITIELFEDRAPKSVANFTQYAKDGFFPGTIFHRVIKGFMIQGGGLDAELSRKPTRAAIENEGGNGLKNTRGSVSMARTAELNSATSQFFINTVDNAALDRKPPGPYAVFGKVIEGMDVVDKIEKVRTTTRGPYNDVPVEPVVIKAVTVKAQ